MKKIGEIENVVHNYELIDNEIIAITGNNDESFLTIFDSNFEEKIRIAEVTAYDFISYHDTIFITNIDADKSFIIDKTTGKIKELPYVLHIKGEKLDDRYFCYSEYNDEECYLMISLNNGEIIEKHNADIGFGNVKNIKNKSFFSRKDWEGVLAYFEFPNNLIWQRDFSDLCSYLNGEKAKINDFIVSNDNVFVFSGLSIVSISLKNGNIIWHTKLDSYQSFGLLKGHFLYTSSNAYINKINAVSGEIVFEKELNGLGPASKFMWYDNKIWTRIDDNTNSILSIDPENGTNIKCYTKNEHNMDGDLYQPRFYLNKMTFLDFSNTLHIFDMENNKC